MNSVAAGDVREVEIKDLPDLSSIPGVETGWGLASLTKEFLRSSSVFGVIAVDRNPVGYAVMQIAGDEAYLCNIAIHPDFRGLGLGRALLEWVIEQGLKQGIARILLEVREGNTVATALYLSSGFKEVGRRPGMYSDGETAVVMELRMLDFEV